MVTPYEPPLRKAVFLDRDGVLIKSNVVDGMPISVLTLDEMQILPGVPEALRDLHEAGFLLIVATNQPNVASGRQRRETIEMMNLRLRNRLLIDDIKVCYHNDADGCACRKPKPGLLIEAATQWSIDLTASYMIGDRWRDIDAGAAVGCRTILIQRFYREPLHIQPDLSVASLGEAARAILLHTGFPRPGAG